MRGESGGHPLRHGWFLVVATSLVYAVAVLQRSSLGVRTTEAAERFGMDPASLAYLPAISLFAYALTQVPVGLLLDRIGPRAISLVAVACLSAGSLLLGVADDAVTAAAARVLLGMGDACTFLTVLRVAANHLPTRQFGLASAFANACGAGGQLVGTAPLTRLLDDMGWTYGFVLVGVATLALALPALLVPPAVRARGGATPIASALTHDGRGLVLACFGHAMLMGQFLAFTIMWGHPYLTRVEGLTASRSTGLVALSVLAFGCGSVVLALSTRLAAPRASGVAGVAVATAGAWIAVAAWPGRSPVPLLSVVAVLSGAAASVVAVAFAIARRGADRAQVGVRAGVVNGFSFASTAVLLVVVGLTQGPASGLDVFPWALASCLVAYLVCFGYLAQQVRARRVQSSFGER